MKWRRGFWRAWQAASILWVFIVTYRMASIHEEYPPHPREVIGDFYVEAFAMAIVGPLAFLVLLGVARLALWIARGLSFGGRR